MRASSAPCWPSTARRQLALLVPGWLHGCIGVHFAFSRRPLYQRLKPVLFAAALLLPVLGALGFLSMAREMQTTAAVRAVAQAAPHGALASAREGALATYFAACTLVFLARAARGWRERRAGTLVRIRYPQRSVQVPRGWSVLEASRGHHLPHLAVCGGRARCSTCRVQVVDGESACPPPDEIEAATLRRIRAAPDVRLACQLRPRGDVAVVPLLAAPGASPRPAPAHGVEKELALVCIEWRDFATLAHALLPQDEVFLATRFRRAVQAVALQHAAVACNVSGERVTLAFGLACDAREGCRQALAAARAAERSLAALAGLCARQFGARPEFALCAHVGIAALGETEDEPQHPPAAAGPAVREAQHLARAGAQAGARLVISLALLRQAGAEAWARSRPGARALAGPGGAEALSLPSLEDVDQVLASRAPRQRAQAARRRGNQRRRAQRASRACTRSRRTSGAGWRQAWRSTRWRRNSMPSKRARKRRSCAIASSTRRRRRSSSSSSA